MNKHSATDEIIPVLLKDINALRESGCKKFQNMQLRDRFHFFVLIPVALCMMVTVSFIYSVCRLPNTWSGIIVAFFYLRCCPVS